MEDSGSFYPPSSIFYPHFIEGVDAKRANGGSFYPPSSIFYPHFIEAVDADRSKGEKTCKEHSG